ncbi:hypothetical protein [Rothia nasimurium]|uniref:arsenate reductase/protein-tyrosine-phosphatase family protein n=1 Tax=Rothia nasimurium TaxID=85336 RepID=UPI001F2389E0|nr:hypothetical protein [Rothia nasimurium]
MDFKDQIKSIFGSNKTSAVFGNNESDNSDLFTILFLCTANISRSAYAEYFLKSLRCATDENSDYSQVKVHSAGTHALTGHDIDHNISRFLNAEAQVHAKSHKARQQTESIIVASDLVLTMTTAHRSELLQQYPKAYSKIFTIAEFVAIVGAVGDLDQFNSREELVLYCHANRQTGYGSPDVPDPFGHNDHVYTQVVEQINSLVEDLARYLNISILADNTK